MNPFPDPLLLLPECSFSAVRSGGKGGQNVNKVATKVILVFDILNSELLDDEQKEFLIEVLGNRVSAEGFFRVVSSTARTQGGNRKEVEAKFVRILARAFKPRIERIPTEPTSGSVEKRIRNKKQQSARKAARITPSFDESTDG